MRSELEEYDYPRGSYFSTSTGWHGEPTSTATTEEPEAPPMQPRHFGKPPLVEPVFDPSRAYDHAYMKAYQKALRKYQKQERRHIYASSYKQANMLTPDDLVDHINSLSYALRAFNLSRRVDSKSQAAARLLTLVGKKFHVGESSAATIARAQKVHDKYVPPKEDQVKKKINQ